MDIFTALYEGSKLKCEAHAICQQQKRASLAVMGCGCVKAEGMTLATNLVSSCQLCMLFVPVGQPDTSRGLSLTQTTPRPGCCEVFDFQTRIVFTCFHCRGAKQAMTGSSQHNCRGRST